MLVPEEKFTLTETVWAVELQERILQSAGHASGGSGSTVFSSTVFPSSHASAGPSMTPSPHVWGFVVVVVVGTGVVVGGFVAVVVTVVGGFVVGVAVVVVTVAGTAPALATCVTRQSSWSRVRFRRLPNGSEGSASVQSKSLGLMNAPGIQSNRTCSNGPEGIAWVVA